MHSITTLLLLGLSGLTLGSIAGPNYSSATSSSAAGIQTHHPHSSNPHHSASHHPTSHHPASHHSTTTKVVTHTYYTHPTAAPVSFRTAKRINHELSTKKREERTGLVPGTAPKELGSIPINPEATEVSSGTFEGEAGRQCIWGCSRGGCWYHCIPPHTKRDDTSANEVTPVSGDLKSAEGKPCKWVCSMFSCDCIKVAGREEISGVNEEASGNGLFALLTRDLDLAPRDDCKWVCSGASCDCIHVGAATSAVVSGKFLGAMAVFAAAVATGGIA